MTLKTRRIIYISLIIFFLIAAPITLFYSLGYSFDWQKKTLIKTGAFYFESYPSNAEIIVNNKKTGTTALYIKRLLPKNYDVKIAKEGFYAWEKKLPVESQIVTEARNVFLVPQNQKAETIKDAIAPEFSLADYFLKDTERKKAEQAKTTAASILKTDSYALSGDKIFYLQPTDYVLYQADMNGLNKQQLALEPLPADIYKISVALNQANISALGKSGRLYVFNPDDNVFELAETGVKNADFSLDSKKLLYNTASEIWVLYLEKILIQPYHEANEKELLTRFAENINSAIWYPEDNEHIIFTVGNTIKITELDGRDKRNTFDIIKAGQSFETNSWDKPQLYYNLKEELLYFINNNKLFSIQIKALQPIIEATGLFNYGK